MDTSLVVRRAELEPRDYELSNVIEDGRVGIKLAALPGSFKPKKVAQSRLLYRYDAATKQGTPLGYTREQHSLDTWWRRDSTNVVNGWYRLHPNGRQW